MKNLHPRTLDLLSLSIILLVNAPDLRAEEEDPFFPGGSCAALAYSTTGELADLLNEAYADDLGSFCIPEERVECSDYSPFLKGRGRLVTGEDGYHCTLHLER